MDPLNPFDGIDFGHIKNPPPPPEPDPIIQALSDLIAGVCDYRGGLDEDTEKKMVNVREAARSALLAQGIVAVIQNESGCYACGFDFEGETPSTCPNCKRKVTYIDPA